MSSLPIHPFLFLCVQQSSRQHFSCACARGRPRAARHASPQTDVPPWLQVVTFLSDRYGAGGGVSASSQIYQCAQRCVSWISFAETFRWYLGISAWASLSLYVVVPADAVWTSLQDHTWIYGRWGGDRGQPECQWAQKARCPRWRWYLRRETHFKTFPSLSFSITPSVLDIRISPSWLRL